MEHCAAALATAQHHNRSPLTTARRASNVIRGKAHAALSLQWSFGKEYGDRGGAAFQTAAAIFDVG